MRLVQVLAAIFALVALIAVSTTAFADGNDKKSFHHGQPRGEQIDLPFEGEFDPAVEPPVFTTAGLKGRANLWEPDPKVGILKGVLSIGGGPENAKQFLVRPIGPIEDKHFEDENFAACIAGETGPGEEFYAGFDRLVFVNMQSRVLHGTGILDWHREVVCMEGKIHEFDRWGLAGALVSPHMTGFLKLGTPIPFEPEADLAVLFADFGPMQEFAEVGDVVDVPVLEEVINNGPDGPVGAEISATLQAGPLEPIAVVTPELLGLVNSHDPPGVVRVARQFSDGTFEEFEVFAPDEFSAGPGGGVAISVSVPLGPGEALFLEELFRVGITEPGEHFIQVEKVIGFAGPGVDPNPGNNHAFIERLIGPPPPTDADLAIAHFEVIAPPEMPVNTPFAIEVFEEITNLGPDGPVPGIVSQFLFPPSDCETDFEVTQELLALTNGVVAVQLDGVVTEYFDPIVVNGPAGTEHIGPIFVVPVDVGQVIGINEFWTVECANTSNHHFRVEKFVHVEGVVDPDPGNNEVFAELDIALFGVADVAVTSLLPGVIEGPFGPGIPLDVPVTVVLENNGPDSPVETNPQINVFAPSGAVSVEITQPLLDLSGGRVIVVVHFAGVDQFFEIDAPTIWHGAPGENIGVLLNVPLETGNSVEIQVPFTVEILDVADPFVSIAASVNPVHAEDTNPANNLLVNEILVGGPG